MSSFTLSAAGWSHDVVVGDLGEARDKLQALCGSGVVPAVTDERVLGLHGERLAELIDFAPIIVPAGEEAKSWAVLQQLIESLSGLGLTRDRPVIAFGGGSVGDVAGLAASLFKRGCAVIHVPTTLLAQVDSAVGGKTAIDAAGQKNLVGSFHPPALVLCDPAFLGTLDARQLRSGYAEIVKYGLIDDPAFFDWCEANGGALLAGDTEARSYAIKHCLKAKARLIGDDLRDVAGRRALLNLGHSFAHAIEALSGFDVLLHGEAVAVGMVLAFELSAEMQLCAAEDVERVRLCLRSAGLPTRLPEVGLGDRGSDLLPLLSADKKAGAGGLVLILVNGIGQAFVARDISPERVASFLTRAG